MAKDKFPKRRRTEYKSSSGKDKNIPGQFCLDINVNDATLDGLIEQQPMKCSPYYSRQYYEAFKEFLKKSGSFGRTWHLYKAIEGDPEESQINWRLNHETLSEKDREYLESARDRLKVMREKQHCDTMEELFAKASNDWDSYKKSLKWLITCSARANVPITADDKTMKNIMISFFHLDDRIRGNCRREYYRDKYINKAIKTINKSGYYPPISIYEMEEAFKADKDWQERFLHRKKEDTKKT